MHVTNTDCIIIELIDTQIKFVLKTKEINKLFLKYYDKIRIMFEPGINQCICRDLHNAMSNKKVWGVELTWYGQPAQSDND